MRERASERVRERASERSALSLAFLWEAKGNFEVRRKSEECQYFQAIGISSKILPSYYTLRLGPW